MKLLWELMMSWSCFGSAKWGTEGGTLCRTPERQSPRRRKRVGSVEWKPSLCSISEDKVVAVARRAAAVGRGGERKAAKPGSSRAARKASGGGSRARVHVRGSSEDYGGASYTAAIPAFSPTPFMF